ncbi:MAG: lipid-A-disaccharide synthase [Flavobacteriales bacterium]|nr:lipid-A-disaccharide synthase [Flavobacteriales bacterium]
MKYYLIAGEASGDLHGSNLIKELKKQDPNAEFRAWGGDHIQDQGAHLVKHIKDLAFMGFVEVIMNLGTILKNIGFCKKDIESYQPDVLILIDYPGFNLRIAEWAKKKGIKVFYYISPQIWAWKQNRGFKIREVVDKMFVILPFEKEFYKKFDFEVEFVGHPLLDAIEQFRKEKVSLADFAKIHGLNEKPIIALLPGSRKQEIEAMLPVFLKVQKHFPAYQFIIAGAPSQTLAYYKGFAKNDGIKILQNRTYDLLLHASAALVSSGTATLETALFKVPEVVCYKGGAISVMIARLLVKVKFISLVNLIMDKEIVRELIQSEFNEKQITAELKKILTQGPERDQLMANYQLLEEKLGGSGASQITASLMLKTLSEGK